MTTARRRIAVVTGSRADYGLLKGVLTRLQKMDDVDLQVIACGMHLLPKFGETWRIVEADGFAIAAKIDLELSDDRAETVARGTGIGVAGFAEALPKLAPDLLVVLGDRYEILVGRGRGDAVEYSDRPYPWRRGHGRRVRRRDPPCHHQDGLRAFHRRRAVSAARHPDGRESGFCL